MKKLFTNDTFFAVVTWFSAIATIPYVIVVSCLYSKQPILFENFIRSLIAICLVVTYISYKKHDKNVMKGMIGAILMALLVIAINSMFVNSVYFKTSIVAIIMMTVIFTNHFIINSDHHSRPLNIAINQILTIVFAIVCIVADLSLLSTCKSTMDTIVTVAMAFAQPCCLFSLICIESKLDAYRIKREADGWVDKSKTKKKIKK